MNDLTASDRCDRCGAQAYARTRHEYDNGNHVTLLLWCAHHFRANAEALTPNLVTSSLHLLTDSKAKATTPA